MAETCKTCQFWAWDARWQKGVAGYNGDGKESECRLRGPVLREAVYTPGPNAMWPHTKDSEWCGEHQSRGPA